VKEKMCMIKLMLLIDTDCKLFCCMLFGVLFWVGHVLIMFVSA
jgi:hypothetical protein